MSGYTTGVTVQCSFMSSRPPSSHPPSSLTERHPTLERLRSISNLLDNAIQIPGTDYRIGLDPILGLLPAGGDIVGTVLSAYLIVEAARLQTPTNIIARMAFNIALETIIGAVPVVGDLFDFAWKANARNLKLLESQFDQPARPARPRPRQRWRVFLILMLLGLVLTLVIAGYIALLRWIVGLLGG